MAPRKKTGSGKCPQPKKRVCSKRKAPQTRRKSRRLRKKSPCPGLSLSRGKGTSRKCGGQKTQKRTRKCPTGNSKVRKGMPKKNFGKHYYRGFVAHVAARIREKKLDMNVIEQASRCWRCLSVEQKEDFKKRIDREKCRPVVPSPTCCRNSDAGINPNQSGACSCVQRSNSSNPFFNLGWQSADDGAANYHWNFRGNFP